MSTNEQIEKYRMAAEQGDALAQCYLADMYDKGQGVPQDDAEAAKWFRKSAAQGNARAQFCLGWYYVNGRGVSKDDAAAVKWYRMAAEQGDALAQCYLASMYENGQGVPKDVAEAVKWYSKAAEQRNSDAQYHLGLMYLNGTGILQDDVQAVGWFREAAVNGHFYAQTFLGWMYQNGKGEPRNDFQAVMWYRKAADQGHSDAQYFLGSMYENGWGVPQNTPKAITLYRKAAQQGHESAKKNLERLKVPIEQENLEDVSTPDQENASKRNLSAARKSAKASRELGECKPLHEVCTPLIYRQNAFRITGLLVDATTRDIKRRIDDLKAAEEMGVGEEEHEHAFALKPPPSLDLIREAAQRLQDPERRVIEEFFWFWPTEWGKGKSDPALSALHSNDKDAAFNTWSRSLSNKQAPTSTVAKHNLAVMYHLVALDSEHVALERNIPAEQLDKNSGYWRKCFRWWEELTEDEVFWSLVTARIRMIDDPRLTTGFARRMRATFPEAMDKINAMLVISFAEQGKLSLAANHITYMKETHHGLDNVPKTLAIVTAPLKTRVRNAVENATTLTQREPGKAAVGARELLQAVREPLQIMQVVLPSDDAERVDLCDSVAETTLTCQIAYARETEDWKTCLEILDLAQNYAFSEETKKRIAENRSIFANNHLYSQYFDPLSEKIKEIEARPSLVSKVQTITAEIIPNLRSFERLSGMSAEVYTACADLVALYLRGLSVATYNQDGNLAEAIRILDIAIQIARGNEAKEQLNNDKAQLVNIREETTKHNLHIKIRSDEIEVTNDFVRYNNQRIPASKVHGIKFGVFVQYTNGIKTSSSYLIDITDGQAGYINIECKRIFRSEAQAEQDFNRILEAVFHQIVPSLVQRLSEGILSGRPLQMDDCRMTAQGVYITTGKLWWKKETLVPFADLRFGNYQGHLSVLSAKDKEISASMALRDTWNAALFEYIVKAVAQLKSERRE